MLTRQALMEQAEVGMDVRAELAWEADFVGRMQIQNRPPRNAAVAGRGYAPPPPIPERFNNKTVGITVAVSFALMAALATVVVLSSLLIVPPPKVASVSTGPTPPPTAPPTPFNPYLGAPLPNNRLILFYGIAYSGIDHNGPASIHPFTFLPQLQQLGQEYTAADPKHPAKLGLDVVVNVADQCSGPNSSCSHFVSPSQIQSYIDFCQANNLYLFLDLQFGRSSVQGVLTYLMPYLERYPFVELALDTEFHFYPYMTGGPPFELGNVTAQDVNWAVDQLAQIPMKYHVPEKVLMIHEWTPGVLIDKAAIKTNKLVSIVLHSDGFGYADNKIGDYHQFVQVEKIQYGGFKLFFNYDDCPSTTPGCSFDNPQWTAQQVMSLSPAPLVISYE
jgi:hypothetical protein